MQSLQSKQNHTRNNPDLLSQCRILISVAVHSVMGVDVDPEEQLHQRSTMTLRMPIMPRDLNGSVLCREKTETNFRTNSTQGYENVDKLAKAALNIASCSEKPICWSDLKRKVNAYIHTFWQENWDARGQTSSMRYSPTWEKTSTKKASRGMRMWTNLQRQLHEVLNLGGDLSKRGEGVGRKWETVMCKLRVGSHTWLTQSYLLKSQGISMAAFCAGRRRRQIFRQIVSCSIVITIHSNDFKWASRGMRMWTNLPRQLHEVLNLGGDLSKRGEGVGRKWETVMCKLRVGSHTWLTQSYLLKSEKQPFCYACDSLYTVRHILIECPDFQVTRRKYFSVTDMYRLFREANPSRIVGYLRELGVYRII
ncbi:ribonuclease hi [Plakobranchus ocellatus]|uniref:Ribonuclease hi n=1 Tax=Plakobranchus ocellatus TaxID=259542 RepID=A0AAV3ZMG4_9GAST|nr:ribonuclease hi [Plakobranchus ocellatus]